MGISFKKLSYADRPVKAVLKDGEAIWRAPEAPGRKAWALWCASDSTLIFVYDDIA